MSLQNSYYHAYSVKWQNNRRRSSWKRRNNSRRDHKRTSLGVIYSLLTGSNILVIAEGT